MSLSNIHIVTGKVKSGKTTKLTEWCKNVSGIAGILQPVINGKRYLQSIRSNEIYPMEKNSSEQNVVTIGNYYFDRNIFKWGNDLIISEFIQNPEWLVIDEIGPLELNDEGFSNAVKFILSWDESVVKKIFVVRDTLLEKFFSYYKIDKNHIKFFNFEINH